ncbi:cysteine-rich venom protein-like [Erpetoichthys calabaricus]|uniref:cysteine-rich venom protein-like n=1 Tax=Erpetoichthys calabaricus TaxID=27687 RepID=UPI002234DD47|nr:cysteine-rich venom protein-like [Erpetoichthys calabaricus]
MCFLSPEILTTDPNVQKTIVDKHNAVRELVLPTATNMVKMEWNTEAAANAEKRATACAKIPSLQNERTISECSCGENVFQSSNERQWDSAIQEWENEKQHFEFGKPPKNGKVAGHYTQVRFIYHS